MITPAYATTMASYNAEMNRRVYAAASRLTEVGRRQDLGAFWSSIHGTLSHLVWADHMWMSRLDGWTPPSVKLAQSPAYFPGFEALSAERVRTDTGLSAWAEGLRAEWLDGTLVWYSGATQREQIRPRALILMHLFNHQTHHRGQVHAMLTRLGQDSGATDLPFVL